MEIRRVDNGIRHREIDLTDEMVRILVRQMEIGEHDVTETESQLIQDSSEREATQTNGDRQCAVEN